MALTNNEITALRTIITREGGLQNVVQAVQALAIGDLKASGVTTLGSAISVTVSNWPAIAAFVSGPGANAVTLYAIMADIQAAAAAQDATKLGPLLVALYAATKANLGL